MVDALADAFEHPRFGRLRLPRPLALLAALCIMGGLLWVVGRTIGRNVTAVVAAAVYKWVGVEVLRRAWLNTDALWVVALLATGMLMLSNTF